MPRSRAARSSSWPDSGTAARRRPLSPRLGVRGRSSRAAAPQDHAMAARAHTLGPVGRVSDRRFDPAVLRANWNFSHLAAGPARAVLSGDAATRRHAAARIRARRRRSRDRDRAGHFLSRLDLQRPGARADDARDRRRSRPRELPQPGHRTRTRFTSTAGIRRRWTARCPSTGHARATVRLRVRRRARSACTSITATPCR